nr:glycosyltransferase family 4 protein [uncultured Acetatifactor sp.]
MDDKAYRTIEILFFGAGKIGRYWMECCRDFGILPRGMLDNDKTLSGSLCEGVPIYHPDNLQMLSFEYIFITCGREEEIYRQLLSLGVEKDKIIVGSHKILDYCLYYAVCSYTMDCNVFSYRVISSNIVVSKNLSEKKKILFDLRNGMVLGGVESWVYSLAKELKGKGYQGLYLAADEAGPRAVDETFPVRILEYSELFGEKDKVELCLREIIKNLPCTMICNFPQNIFWAACIAKKLFPGQVRIVAVQHSDDQLYYETYSLWQEYIDKCLVISSRIEEKLLSLGMEKSKIEHLEWKVTLGKTVKREWSVDNTCLQLGYAGRVTVTSKRADLLPVLAIKLRERGICFQMNIAGAGDYSETLQECIKAEGLQGCIRLEGYIDRSDIPTFWKRQDIMVSCSEREGHSISQSEAMAAGAVPVITDVSGAADDVTDGYNGYIVDIGDVDSLADRICRLYHNRDMLKQMGQNAHRTIYERQVHMNQAAFWEKLLREVWKSERSEKP